MPQKSVSTIGVSQEVRIELENRKKALSIHIGRAVSFDEVLRSLLGWRLQ